MRLCIVVLLAVIGVSVQAAPASADVVPFPEAPVAGGATFSNNSRRVRALLVYGDTIYAGGRFTVSQGSVSRSNLAAFDFDGNLRPEFSVNVNGPVWALATDGDSLFVGGEFTRLELNRHLAAVDLVTGAVRRPFRAHLDGALDSDTVTGVHALAIATDTSTQPAAVRLLVGGNFTMVNSTTDNRAGLAALATDRGTLDTTRFTEGVQGGYVRALVAAETTVYVGGEFTSLQGRTANLAALTMAGSLQSGTFSTSGQPVLDLTLDAEGNRLFAAIGGSGNGIRGYVADGLRRGSTLWRGPRVGGSTLWVNGDVQAVHYFGTHVYFGFHDGLFAEPDPYKLAAVDAATGNLEVDSEHQGLVCSNDSEEEQANCWLPELDATNGQGFFGVWAIRDFWDPATAQQALLVGGDFTQIGGVLRTRRMAIFRAP